MSQFGRYIRQIQLPGFGEEAQKKLETASVLKKEIIFHPALTYHVLVHIEKEKGLLTAIPYPISGSGDLPALARADAILSLPPERNFFCPGETYEIAML